MCFRFCELLWLVSLFTQSSFTTSSEGLGCLVGCLDCFQMLLSAVTNSPTRSLCLPYTLGHRLLLKIWYCFGECGGLSQPLCSQVSWGVTITEWGGGESLPLGNSGHRVAPSASTQTSRVGPSEGPADVHGFHPDPGSCEYETGLCLSGWTPPRCLHHFTPSLLCVCVD